MPGTPTNDFINELWKIIAAAITSGIGAFVAGTKYINRQTAKKLKKEAESLAIDDQIKISEYVVKQKNLLEKENMILQEKHKILEDKMRLLEQELLAVRKQLTIYKTISPS